jgi:hypothetical protein
MSSTWKRLVTFAALSCVLSIGPAWADGGSQTGGGQDPPDRPPTGGGATSDGIDLLLDVWTVFTQVLVG